MITNQLRYISKHYKQGKNTRNKQKNWSLTTGAKKKLSKQNYLDFFNSVVSICKRVEIIWYVFIVFSYTLEIDSLSIWFSEKLMLTGTETQVSYFDCLLFIQPSACLSVCL